MVTLDVKHVFTKVTNFHSSKLESQHAYLRSFAHVFKMDNEKKKSILFHI
jgi:hypothetical protein